MRKFNAPLQERLSAHVNLEKDHSFWDEFLSIAKTEFGPTIFNNWLSGLKFHSLSDEIFVISAPSKFVREWIIANYFSKIKTLVEKIDKSIKRVDIILNHSKDVFKGTQNYMTASSIAKLEEMAEGAAHPYNSNLSISSDLNTQYTFENFVIGASNKVAHAAAKRISEFPSNPSANKALYIHGNVGMGKTHLLQSIAHQVSTLYPDLKVAFMSVEQFMHRYIMSVKANDVLTFREKLRSLDMLLIDDLQFICDKSSTQKEFANTLNALLEGGRHVVISCDRSPYLLDVDARTKSRLAGCSVVEIEQADFELRLKILNSKSSILKAKIESNILEFIASNISSSIREVEGALNRVVTHCSLNDTKITMESSKSILRDCLKAHESEVPIDKIISIVAESQGVTKADVLSQSRLSKLVHSRQMIASLAKALTKYSLQDIGKSLGDKDHATVIYYIRQFKLKMERNSKLMSDFALIKDQIQAHNLL